MSETATPLKPTPNKVFELREELKLAKKEIARLRERIALKEPRRMDEWMELPLAVRDEMATRALWDEFCDHGRAANRLGFKWPVATWPDRRKLAQREADKATRAEIMELVFGTPGVRERLDRSLEDAEQNRISVVKRLTQTAINGNDDRSVRAAQVLAKLEGWSKEETAAPQTTIHLWGLTAGASAQGRGPKNVTTIDHAPLATDDPRVILGHEPGAPVRFGAPEQAASPDTDADE